MLKSSVGYSTDKDSYMEGGISAKGVLESIQKPKIAMLYTSVDCDIPQVIKGAKDVLGNTPIIGCTSSAGVMTQDGFITSENGFTGIMGIEEESMVVAVAGSERGNNARETGRKVAREALEKSGKEYPPAFFYMVASPKEEEEYIRGIEDAIGTVPVFGGSAADNTVEGKWSIFVEDKIFSDGVAVAFFYTDKKMSNVFTGSYKETNNVGVITKVEGRRTLVEIDNKPAIEKYAQWTGEPIETLKGTNLLVTTITKPLGVKDTLGTLTAIRHPMFGNENYSMNIGADLAVNTAIIQMEASIDDMILATGTALRKVNEELNNKTGALFLVHCGGRRLGIGDRIDEVYKLLVKEANGLPFLTVFTFGEYGQTDHSDNTTGGLMLSFVGIEK